MTKGFTVIEMCLSLMISSIILFLLIIGIQSVNKIEIEPASYCDIVILSKQLSVELMESEILEVNSNSLVYKNDTNTFTISLKKGTLVKEPGYVVLLYNVDDVSFDYYDLIIMDITRGEEEYELSIGLYPYSY